MEILRKLFINKNNGQASLTLPKELIEKLSKNNKVPPIVKLKVSIPRDYLSKVKEIKNGNN